MIRTCLAIFLLAGCASPHLGPNVGVATRAAFAAQVERAGRPIAPLDARDAQLIMMKHRTKLRAFGDAAGLGTSAGGGGGGGGNNNMINLQAK